MKCEARRQKFLHVALVREDGTACLCVLIGDVVCVHPEQRVLFDEYLARARARVMGGA